MKKVFTLSGVGFMLILLVLSCNRDKDDIIKPSVNPAEKTLSDFFIKNGVQSQFFTFNSDSVNAFITTNKGYLYIPKNSFVTTNNQPVTGAITLEVKEILTKKDMILSGIFSVSGGKPLISGGEYYINATQNGTEIKLASNSAVTMSATAYSIPSSTMKIFYASNLNENTDWGNPSTDTANVTFNGVNYSNFFPITNLHWINCDYFFSTSNPQTTINVTINNTTFNANNTIVFISFNGLNSTTMLHSSSGQDYSPGYGYTLPIGMNITVVAISKINGQYFSAFKPVTIVNNDIENIDMTATTIDDFKLKLGSLP